MISLLAALLGCSGGGLADSAAAEDACDAPDDFSGLPDMIGYWTVDFAQELFDESCGLSKLSQTSEDWIRGAAMEIRGTLPDNIKAVIGEEEFWGAVTAGGGVVFEGTHQSEHGPMAVSIGGLVYEDVYQLETTVIEGWAVLGLDSLGDGYIDCRATGNFVARRSGR